MFKVTLQNPSLRKRARQFTRLVRHSAMTPRTGETRKPKLVTNGDLGLTFIGHSSFFLQMGGQNVLIDPNFARWLFLLKRLRKPVTLAAIKNDGRFSTFALVRMSRLSVMPVSDAEWKMIEAMSDEE